MHKLMTEETPLKVVSLLGSVVVSMFILFAVSSTNCGFQKCETSLPDPFDSGKVVSMLDSSSQSYSAFLNQNLFSPVQHDLAYYQDTAAWVMDNADEPIVNMLGLQSLVQPKPQVAGAYIDVTRHASYSGGNGLFAALGIQ